MADDPIRVVLVSPRNPLNIGAVARAMSNFGFTQMRLVNPYDLAFQEAKSAVKSGYILAQATVCATVADAVGDCALVVGTTALGNRDLHVPLRRLDAAAPIIREAIASTSQPVAILFGSEKFGLSNDDISFCHWLMRIPTRNEHGSMNLGQAVALVLYELKRDPDSAAPFAPGPTLTGAEQERLTSLMLEVLEQSGYVSRVTAESTVFKLRRLIRRLQMPAGDAEVWMGMFRQILWKLKSLSKEGEN